jgi:hypothetical protein
MNFILICKVLKETIQLNINYCDIFHTLCRYDCVINILQELRHKYSNNLILMFTRLQYLSDTIFGVFFSWLEILSVHLYEQHGTNS